MDCGKRRICASRLNAAEIGSEQLSFLCNIFLRQAFGVSQLFQAQAKLPLDKVFSVGFHDSLYLFCALIRTHTNSYIKN